MKQKLQIAAIVLVTFFPLMVVTQAWTYSSTAALDGREVFVSKCGNCHSIASAGIEAKIKSAKMQGPDLGGLKLEPERLAAYLKKEADLDGSQHKLPFKGSDEELQALIDWLLEQKAQ